MSNKSSKRTAYIGGGNDGSVFKLFEQKGFTMVDEQKKAEFLVWTGGCDINPRMYGQKSIDSKPYYNDTRDQREMQEWANRPKSQKTIGICRGFQMLNIMHGGQLYQDCNNHRSGDHDITYYPTRGKTTRHRTNSVHHQMIIPGMGVRVVGRAEEATYVVNSQGIKRPIETEFLDPEIAWFERNGYGVQFHPEWSESSAKIFWHGMKEWYSSRYGESLL